MSIPLPREAELQRAILQWLALNGIFAVRVNSGARPWTDRKGRRRLLRFNDQPGCSDVLACLPGGQFGAIEVKRPGEKLTAEQASFQGRIRQLGGLAIVAHSTEDLEPLLTTPSGVKQ
jgi:hypothetical protein